MARLRRNLGEGEGGLTTTLNSANRINVQTTKSPAFVVALASIGVGLLVQGCERAGRVAMSLASPRATYVVQVTGDLSAPSVPMIEHPVRVTVKRGPALLVQRHEVDFADWLDAGFRGKYGPPEWPEENILRFVALGSKGATDVIRVQNRSRRPVPFVKVICQDLFLLFDLPPNSVISSPVTPQRPDAMQQSWIEAEGESGGGEPIRSEGRNFQFVKDARAYEYVVTISERGIEFAQIVIHQLPISAANKTTTGR